MKLYITMSFKRAEEEVKEWLQFFLDQGVNMMVEEIQVVPKFFCDDAALSTDEIGFEPVLVGKTYDSVVGAAPEHSYDDYFRIEEILATGKYRYRADDKEGRMREIEVEKLDYAQACRMLIEWSAHMLADGIRVKYRLSMF